VIEKEIWQRFRDRGLKIFAIGVKENGEQASSWSSQHGLTYPVGLDPEGEIYKKFGTGSVPYHVLMDKDLRIYLSQEDFKKGRLIEMIQNNLGIANRSSRKPISTKFIRGLLTLVRKTRS
jgi:peroxiredoxin